jgi:ABC-2 type transport system permease protein
MSDIIALILPGMMYFWVMFIAQMPMQEVINEREINTLARILASSVTPGQFVLSKMIRSFLLCVLIQSLLLLITSIGFGTHWGTLPIVALVVLVSAWSMTGLLAFLFSLARTKEQAHVFSTITLLMCALVGGSMFPYEQLPGFLQMVGRFSPNHWGIIAMQKAAHLKSIGELVIPLTGLAGIGAGGCGLAYVLFKRQILKGGRP